MKPSKTKLFAVIMAAVILMAALSACDISIGNNDNGSGGLGDIVVGGSPTPDNTNTPDPTDSGQTQTDPPSGNVDQELLGHWRYDGSYAVGFHGGNIDYAGQGNYFTFYSFYEDGTFQCESRVGGWVRFKGDYAISGDKILFTNIRLMARNLSSWPDDAERCDDVIYEFNMGFDNESGRRVLNINDLGWNRDQVEPLYAFIETDDPSPGRVVQIWEW